MLTDDSVELLGTEAADFSIDLAGASDVGRVRKQNQDHYLIADLQRLLTIRDSDLPHEECQKQYGAQTGRLLVLCDGMGGHRGGEQASSTAVQTCARYVLDMMHWFLKLSSSCEEDFMDELSSSLEAVQKTLREFPSETGDRMGTTVTMAYVLWPRLYIVHAGDSRCYLLRDQTLRQLTTDHTVAQQLLSAQALTAQEAETSRWRHVLWNCVSSGREEVRPEVLKINLQSGDTLLLCSDGLTGMVGNDVIQKTLLQGGSARATADQLIAQANDAGGRDNISVVVGRFGSDASATSASAASE